MRRIARFAAAERLKIFNLEQHTASKATVMTLEDPTAYYAFLREQISNAKHSITLSALYLGSGVHEGALMEDLRLALSAKPKLDATVILDHSRAQRSSAPLAALVDEFGPQRVRLLWFQMPQLRGMVSKILPGQLCEALGVYHCKFGVFDHNVILSGANLSEEYFVNRQDRYLYFPGPDSTLGSISNSNSEKEKEKDIIVATNLSHFLLSFVRVVEPHCHSVLPGLRVRPPRASVSFLRSDLDALVRPFVPASSSSSSSSSSYLVACVPTVEISLSPTHTNQTTLAASPASALLMPMVQLAPAGLSLESDLLPKLIRYLAPHCQRAAVSSPYPSFTPSLMRALTALTLPLASKPSSLSSSSSSSSSSASAPTSASSPHVTDPNCTAIHHTSTSGGMPTTQVEVLTSSPTTHGFARGSGPKALVPDMHAHILVEAITQAAGEGECEGGVRGARERGLRTLLYDRSGWTFHAKGLWLWLRPEPRPTSSQSQSQSHSQSQSQSLETERSQSLGQGLSLVSYVGSSNLGERSWRRDFELGFVLATAEPGLVESLTREYAALAAHAHAKKPLQPVATGVDIGAGEGEQRVVSSFSRGIVVAGLAILFRSFL